MFSEAHGFRGARDRVSSKSKHFEMVIKGQTHVPHKLTQSRFSMAGAIAKRWIWRHIKMMGQPKPNSDGPVGEIYLMQKDTTDRHKLYVKDLTKDGGRSDKASYVLGGDSFRLLWNDQWGRHWVDEHQQAFALNHFIIADKSGIRICRICSGHFEQLVKAKYTKDRELIRAEIARHKGEMDEAREQYTQIVYEGISNETCISVAIDAMDQFKSRLPVTATHSAGGIMHKLQLKLTGVIVHGNEKPWSIYVTFPWIRTGANITCTIFADMFFKGVFNHKRDVLIQVDGASDNICKTNVYFFAMILLVAQEKDMALRSVALSRMVSGHTKFDVDQHWSRISAYFNGNKRNGNRRRDVFTLSEYETVCRAAHKNLAEYVVLENTLDLIRGCCACMQHQQSTRASQVDMYSD